MLLKAYQHTFTARDPVCLVIKDMGSGSFYRGKTAGDDIGRIMATAGAPEIEYLDRDLSGEELAGLYTACDCLVHPYRGEGFGLPIAEAMASGLPVIVTGYGAALDYCCEQNAFLIPARIMRFRQKRIDDLETVDYPWLAEPDVGCSAGLHAPCRRSSGRRLARRARRPRRGFTAISPGIMRSRDRGTPGAAQPFGPSAGSRSHKSAWRKPERLDADLGRHQPNRGHSDIPAAGLSMHDRQE